ncbi:hypothetical protein Daesc_006529 [Daldinia eschscholtzii]|uniref:Uncharacterized protein n=1 Tax=Daldinia eschscholtzii TaxID=292717 RepID=A0AAX6MHS4_9PEZI
MHKKAPNEQYDDQRGKISEISSDIQRNPDTICDVPIGNFTLLLDQNIYAGERILSIGNGQTRASTVANLPPGGILVDQEIFVISEPAATTKT